MKVSFYCGAYDYSNGGGLAPSDIDAPDCGATGIIEVNEDEWAEGCVHRLCPRCSNELNQSDGAFELIHD
jgi:hypothetical protein